MILNLYLNIHTYIYFFFIYLFLHLYICKTPRKMYIKRILGKMLRCHIFIEYSYCILILNQNFIFNKKEKKFLNIENLIIVFI